MNREDQRKITKNLIALRKAMQKDVDNIADRLYDAGVFTKDARNEITSVRPNIAQLKCGVLINKLLRSGPGSYEKFRTILKDMGYIELVDSMEKSVSPVPNVEGNYQQADREKTFVIKNPTISERLQMPTSKKQSNTKKGQGQDHHDNQIEEVQQLERMMTFVMTSIDNRDNNNKNKADFKRDFKQRLMDESRGDEQLMGFFKTLRYNSFSLTSQTIAH